ncbi:MAG: hypothetical protein AB7F43_01790 [Bacteriovoracia bacterium]
MFTIKQVSEIVSQSENLVRQHIHRGHLESIKLENAVYVEKGALLKWAKGRSFALNERVIKDFEMFHPTVPASISNLEAKASRCKILLLEDEGTVFFLGATIKTRRTPRLSKDADWKRLSDENSNLVLFQKDVVGNWNIEEFLVALNEGMKLENLSFAASLSRESHYFVGHDHTKEQDRPPYNSPFSHGSKVYECWDLNLSKKQELLVRLQRISRSKEIEKKFEIDFFNYPDKIGNVLIFEALDGCTARCNKSSNRSLALSLDRPPEERFFATISCWLYSEPVFKKLILVDKQHTTIDIDAEFNHYSCDIFDSAGSPVTSENYYILEKIEIGIQARTRTAEIQDKSGKKIATISKDLHQRTQVGLERDIAGLRDLLKWRNYESRRLKLALGGQYFDFGPNQLSDLWKKICALSVKGHHGESEVYLCDPYFLKFIKSTDGKKFLLLLAQELSGREIRILCGITPEIQSLDPNKIVKEIEESVGGRVFSGIRLKAIGQECQDRDGKPTIIPKMHNRWIAHRDHSYTISNSLNFIRDDGATIQKMDSDFHFTRSSFYWDSSDQENGIIIFKHDF